jgi:hypothetical protein
VIFEVRLVGRTGQGIGENLRYMRLLSTLWEKAFSGSVIYGIRK